MQFNEYTQKSRSLKYRKRQAIIERIKISGMIVALVAAYCFVGYIEKGI